MGKSGGEESHPIMRPAGTLAALTAASRVLGLVRDIVLAAFFFGRHLDAFVLAFTVPNLFRRLFGEGALSGALVPALVKKIESGEEKRAGALAAKALGAAAAVLGAVAGGGVVAGLLMWAIGGPAGKAGLTGGLLGLTMPYVVLVCGAAVVTAFLNARGRFAVPALQPVILNVLLIAAALVLRSVWALAGAVLLGGAAGLLLNLLQARSLGMPLRPRLDLADRDLRGIAARLLPTLAGLAVFQVNVLLDRLIAYTLIPGHGAVGSLFLGNRLMQLPLGIFAISIGTAALPAMSAAAAKGDRKGLLDSAARAAEGVLFWTVPAAVGLALLAEPACALLFDRGAFTGAHGSLLRTSLVVTFYAPGLVAFGLAGLLARAFYAKGNPKAVMRAALGTVGVNLVLNIVFVLLFQRIALYPAVGRWIESGEAGLALASSASGVVYLALLLPGFENTAGHVRRKAVVRAALALAAGGVAGVLSGYLLCLDPMRRAWEWLWRAPVLPAAVCVGTFAALAVVLASFSPLTGPGKGSGKAAAGPTGAEGLRRRLFPGFLRISLVAAGMGVFTNLVLSSLPVEGDHWLIPVQRALAPVVLGGASYWFLAGIFAAPGYTSAKVMLGRALFGKSSPRRHGGTEKNGAT